MGKAEWKNEESLILALLVISMTWHGWGRDESLSGSFLDWKGLRGRSESWGWRRKESLRVT
jgi:hypothetical protein